MLRTTFLGKKVVPKEINIEVYKNVVRPMMLHGSESWIITNTNKSRMTAIEMRFLRKTKGITRRDRSKMTEINKSHTNQ